MWGCEGTEYTKQGNYSRSVDTHGAKPLKDDRDALIVVWEVLLDHFCSALPTISSSSFERDVRTSKLYPSLKYFSHILDSVLAFKLLFHRKKT